MQKRLHKQIDPYWNERRFRSLTSANNAVDKVTQLERKLERKLAEVEARIAKLEQEQN